MSAHGVPAEWDELADLYDEINEAFIDYDEQAEFVLACLRRWPPGGQPVGRRTRRSAPPPTVLDIGCGTGQHALRLAAEGLKVTGLDSSPRLVAVAKHKARAAGLTGVRFRVADAAELRARRSFDAAICLNYVLSFFHTNERLRAMLEGVFRALRPGGVFILDHHFFFPPTQEEGLLGQWTEECTVRGQRVRMTHGPVVDWDTQLSTDRLTHRFLEGDRVVREVRSTEVRRIILPQDLQYHLGSAGFEVLAWCERWDLEAEPEGQSSAIVARRP